MIIGLCMQYYKSLCVAVTICATLVNIRTNIDTEEQLLTGYTINSAS